MSFEVVTSPSVVLQLCLGVLRDVTVLEPHTRTRSVERRGDLQCVWRFRQLFADDELAGLRARWDNVQAGFVDQPTIGFAETRSRLEEQWARGEEASTEDLRLALCGATAISSSGCSRCET